jgi:Tfp pilus assembly protein PilX
MLKDSQRGVSLYFALIIMSILVAVVFSISSIVLVQIRVIRKMGDSIIAFYAADTGAERTLYEGKFVIPPAGTEYSGTLDNGASYKATILATTSPSCYGKWYC